MFTCVQKYASTQTEKETLKICSERNIGAWHFLELSGPTTYITQVI